MEQLKYLKLKMFFDIEWFEKNEAIVYYINLNGRTLFFNDYVYAAFQYICFIIVYHLIMKLIKDILNKSSDEYF